jgi:hypothetical protein
MYGKVILQVVAAVAMALIGFLDDNFLDTVELINCALVALTAIGVWLVPNLTGGAAKYAKMGVAMLTAGFTVLITAVSAGVDATEWFQVIVAVLAAIGIVGPKAPQVDPAPAIPRTPETA